MDRLKERPPLWTTEYAAWMCYTDILNAEEHPLWTKVWRIAKALKTLDDAGIIVRCALMVPYRWAGGYYFQGYAYDKVPIHPRDYSKEGIMSAMGRLPNYTSGRTYWAHPFFDNHPLMRRLKAEKLGQPADLPNQNSDATKRLAWKFFKAIEYFASWQSKLQLVSRT